MKYLYSLILFFLSLGIIFFFVYPQYQKVLKTENEVKFWKSALESKNEYLKDLRNFDRQLKEEKKFKKINTALPLDEPISEVFRYLYQQASINGVFIKDFNYSSSKPEKIGFKMGIPSVGEEGEFIQEDGPFVSFQLPKKEKLEEIQVSLQVVGSYEAIKNYIGNLEKSARLINFSGFSVEKLQQPEEEAGNILEGSLNFKIYNYQSQ